MEELKLQFAREVAKEKRKLADIQARLEAAPDDNTRANLRNSAQVSRKRLTNLEGILAEVLTALAKSPPGRSVDPLGDLELEINPGEPDVLWFRDCSTHKRTRDFYIDPGYAVTRATLEILAHVRFRFEGPDLGPPLQKLIIITGLAKTGKSYTLRRLIPAILCTYGLPKTAPAKLHDNYDRTDSPNYCIWQLTCDTSMGGYAAFEAGFAAQLRGMAYTLGFTDAASVPSWGANGGGYRAEIRDLLLCLPRDHLHVMMVDEIHRIFTFEQPMQPGQTGHPSLDLNAISESRSFLKWLIGNSPRNVVWIVTGSAMATFWRNLVETHTHGFSLVTNSLRVNLPCKVSRAAMAKTCELLRAKGLTAPDLPQVEQPAIAACLAEEMSAPGADKQSPSEVYERLVEVKGVPKVLLDLRGCLGAIPEQSQKEFLDLFVRLMDPLEGVDPNDLPKAWQEWIRPMLLGADASGQSERVHVDSRLYAEVLDVIVNDRGELQLVEDVIADDPLRISDRDNEPQRLSREIGTAAQDAATSAPAGNLLLSGRTATSLTPSAVSCAVDAGQSPSAAAAAAAATLLGADQVAAHRASVLAAGRAAKSHARTSTLSRPALLAKPTRPGMSSSQASTAFLPQARAQAAQRDGMWPGQGQSSAPITPQGGEQQNTRQQARGKERCKSRQASTAPERPPTSVSKAYRGIHALPCITVTPASQHSWSAPTLSRPTLDRWAGASPHLKGGSSGRASLARHSRGFLL